MHPCTKWFLFLWTEKSRAAPPSFPRRVRALRNGASPFARGDNVLNFVRQGEAPAPLRCLAGVRGALFTDSSPGRTQSNHIQMSLHGVVLSGNEQSLLLPKRLPLNFGDGGNAGLLRSDFKDGHSGRSRVTARRGEGWRPRCRVGRRGSHYSFKLCFVLPLYTSEIYTRLASARHMKCVCVCVCQPMRRPAKSELGFGSPHIPVLSSR